MKSSDILPRGSSLPHGTLCATADRAPLMIYKYLLNMDIIGIWVAGTYCDGTAFRRITYEVDEKPTQTLWEKCRSDGPNRRTLPDCQGQGPQLLWSCFRPFLGERVSGSVLIWYQATL